MNIINGERGSGRTTFLIHAAYVTGARIICPSSEIARYISGMAKKEGLEILEPLGFKDFMDRSCRGFARGERVLMDNADMVLSEILTDYFRVPVEAITINCPDVLKSRAQKEAKQEEGGEEHGTERA